MLIKKSKYIYGDGNTSYFDFAVTYFTHVPNCDIVTHKYVEIKKIVIDSFKKHSFIFRNKNKMHPFTSSIQRRARDPSQSIVEGTYHLREKIIFHYFLTV
jgi:hypothetical protein